MRRRLSGLLALAVLVGAVWWLAPRDPDRQLPAPPPVAAPDGAGRLAVDLVDGASLADLEAVERVIHADLDWTSPDSVDEALAEGDVPDVDDAMAALAGNPLVEAVEPVIELHALGFPNDPLYEKQWHLRAMGAPAGWEGTPRGRGVVVAVVDTGIAPVEDLEGTRILEGRSFVPGTSSAVDDQGHGTHVAGTIAQATNNGKGTAGVAPEATLMPVKVLSRFGSGSSTWIAAGIDWAADNGAQVINLSLGGSYSLVIHNAVKKARKRGVIVVAAAGNSGRSGVSFPGGLPETIGVSAVGPDGSLAPYSSFGKGVDVAAPGGDKRTPGGGVWQDTIDGRGGHVYAEFQGTSMATPHVAGAAAVLLSTGLDDAAVERLILETAAGDGQWNERTGFGRLDLASALSTTLDQHGGTRFGLGAALALALGLLGGLRPGFRARSAAIAGLVAGGLFFLRWLPVDGWWVELLGSGLLQWPAIVLGPTWGHMPLWLSALLPVAVGYTLGAADRTRALALGIACGIGASLLHGAATGALDPAWIPFGLGGLWLAGNGVVSLVVGMALAGTEKLAEDRHGVGR